MKSQGLPMTTIVLIIIVIVVLVAVLLFFFQGIASGGSSTTEQNKFGRCQSECLKVSQGATTTCTMYAATIIDGVSTDCRLYIKCKNATGATICP